MKSDYNLLADYINDLQSKGRYTFSIEQAFNEIDKKPATFNMALHRLSKKGRIKRIASGFYEIVPIEYQSIGSLPASWFIDPFIKFLGIDYYVGLLSAAEIHGASHQQVMAFQVIVSKSMRNIEIGQVRLEFHYQKIIPKDFLDTVKTETGKMLVSCPEVTACDLIKYINDVGQIHNVATVLHELKEKISIDKLSKYVKADFVAVVYVQRLGYLLDFLQLELNTDPLHEWISEKKPDYRPLIMGSMSPIIEKNMRWHILVNEVVEPDL